MSSLVQELFPFQETWCADPEGGGGQGIWTPTVKSKNIRFLSNTGPDPLKNNKATKPAFNVGPSSAHQRTPFNWRFPGWPMIAH